MLFVALGIPASPFSWGPKERCIVPDAPTLKELGYDVSMPAWYTIFCKSDVPENVRAALEKALSEIIQSEAVQATAAEANISLTGVGSADSQIAYENTIKNLTELLG